MNKPFIGGGDPLGLVFPGLKVPDKPVTLFTDHWPCWGRRRTHTLQMNKKRNFLILKRIGICSLAEISRNSHTRRLKGAKSRHPRWEQCLCSQGTWEWGSGDTPGWGESLERSLSKIISGNALGGESSFLN